jgi:hypothetical protein
MFRPDLRIVKFLTSVWMNHCDPWSHQVPTPVGMNHHDLRVHNILASAWMILPNLQIHHFLAPAWMNRDDLYRGYTFVSTGIMEMDLTEYGLVL